MCVCYNAAAIMFVTMAPTKRNAGYSCVGSVCMYAILVPNQQSSHYCHRVSRHIVHYACLIMWHNKDFRPAQDYQACYSTHVLKLCSETADMSVAIAPGDHFAHRIQLHSTSMHFCRVASTFVVVGLSQHVYLLHLAQTRSRFSYACT